MIFPKTEDPAFPDLAASRWNWKVVVIVLLLCVLGAVGARPAYRKAKTWRARALAAQAEGLMEEKKWRESAQKAQGAHRLAPGDPSTLRVLARLYSRVGVPAASDFWVKFLEFPQATAADRKEAIRFALQIKKLDFAEEQLGKLTAAAPNDPETLELAVQLAIEKNDRGGALDLLQRLMAANPAHPSAPVLNAQILSSSPDPQQQAEGKRQLEQLAQGETIASLTALRSLAVNRGLSPEESKMIETRLSAHPLATPEDRLTAISMEIRAEPDKRRGLIDEAIGKFATAGPDSLVALGRWVNQQGEPQQVIDFITLPVSLTRQDLFLVRLDALAALGRWDEIQTILKGEKVPLEEPHRQVFLARAAQQLGEPRAAEARWGDAIRAAGSNPQALLFVAQYAGKIGAADVAEEAYRRLAQNPSFALRASAALIPLLEAKGDTRALRDVMKQLAALAPNERAPRNDAAYLDLLLNENIAAATKTAEQLMREQPNMLAYRTTLALAYLRAGNASAAAELYKNANISWDTAPPGWRAVYAAALAANGNQENAAVAAAELSTARLKPEELELIKGRQ